MEKYYVENNDRRAMQFSIYNENGKFIRATNSKTEIDGLQYAVRDTSPVTCAYTNNKVIGSIAILGDKIEGALQSMANTFK